MLSCFGYLVNAELCISCRILIHSSFELGIQYLFLKRSLSFMLREHFNMKTLTSVFAGKVYCSSCTVMISLAKASSCFLASFHYFSMGSFVDGSNSMISLLSPWDSGPVVLLL